MNWGDRLGEFALRLWDAGDHPAGRGRFEEGEKKLARACELKGEQVSHEPTFAWLMTKWALREESGRETRLNQARRTFEEVLAKEPQARLWWTTLYICLRAISRLGPKSKKAEAANAAAEAHARLLDLCPGLKPEQLDAFLDKVEAGRTYTLDPTLFYPPSSAKAKEQAGPAEKQ